MNELPAGVQVLVAGFADTPKPDVQRDEMDRGPVNQELINTRLRWEMDVTFLMESKQALEEFEFWYTRTIRIIGWFDLKHPRTKKVIRARLVDGERQAAVPIAPGFRASTISAKLEYYADDIP